MAECALWIGKDPSAEPSFAFVSSPLSSIAAAVVLKGRAQVDLAANGRQRTALGISSLSTLHRFQGQDLGHQACVTRVLPTVLPHRLLINHIDYPPQLP